MAGMRPGHTRVCRQRQVESVPDQRSLNASACLLLDPMQSEHLAIHTMPYPSGRRRRATNTTLLKTSNSDGHHPAILAPSRDMRNFELLP